jgi:hypothetical protein
MATPPAIDRQRFWIMTPATLAAASSAARQWPNGFAFAPLFE